MFTEGLLRGESSFDKVEPEDNLTELNVGRVLHADDYDIDTVGISNKQVKGHLVWLVARELPHAHLTHTCIGKNQSRKTEKYPR